MTEKIKGFDFGIDLQAAILWQYNDAARLISLLEQKQGWYNNNASEVWDYWFSGVFNLATATDDGLAVWSIILRLPLYTVGEPSPPGYPAFGFSAFGGNFYNYNFASSLPPVYGLTTEQKRLILQVRYFQLTTRATVPDINRMLAYLFGQGKAYVVDLLNMEMVYVFVDDIDAGLLSALETLDVLPRPSGVKMTIAHGGVPAFGFAAFGLNFDGNFFEG